MLNPGKRRKAGTRFADMRSQEGKLGLTLLQKVLLNEEEQQQQQQQQQGSSAAGTWALPLHHTAQKIYYSTPMHCWHVQLPYTCSCSGQYKAGLGSVWAASPCLVRGQSRGQLTRPCCTPQLNMVRGHCNHNRSCQAGPHIYAIPSMPPNFCNSFNAIR